MKLETGWVTFDAGGAEVRGFLALPAAAPPPLPGVLVIQEAFGVDAHIQDIAGRFATAGYAAFAPDLFSHGGTPEALSAERIEDARRFLDGVPAATWFDLALRAQALAAFGSARRQALEETLTLVLPATRPWDLHVTTVRAAHAWLAAGASRGQRIGSVGFCMGGAVSLRLACTDPELAAAVVFYGLAPPREMVAGLRCPVLGLYAEDDPRITGGVPALVEAMASEGKRFEHHVYPGARHAFHNDTRSAYQVGPARDAWARTLFFLAEHLAGA
jgi:carboxymethylenebutenolidase